MAFKEMTIEFKKKYNEAAIRVASVVFNRKQGINAFTDAEIQALNPIFKDMFETGRAETSAFVKNEINALSKDYKLPLKYNKDVLSNINETSIFNGYYDKRYQDLFTRRELNELKKTILSGKYAGISEEELANNIKKVINVTDSRAKLLARTETQRLTESANKFYFNKSNLRKNFDRVWVTKGDANVRPSHDRMNGKIADKDGNFHSEDVGTVSGPGAGPQSFSINCRCYTKFVKKK